MTVPDTRISLGIEFICWENRLYFQRQYTKTFGLPNSRMEAVLITDEIHDKFISISESCLQSIFNTDSKPSANT